MQIAKKPEQHSFPGKKTSTTALRQTKTARASSARRQRLFQPISLLMGTVLGWLLVMASVGEAAAAGLGVAAHQESAVPVAGVLLPFLAAAISVERIIELLWNYIEWILIRFGKWQGGSLKGQSYVQFKSGTSLLIGLFLGVVVANYSGMRLLGFLQPIAPSFLGAVPAQWDILLTGVVIGAGSKPAHDILGLFTHLKNLIGTTALRQREAAGAALADGILKLSQADSPYTTEVPGVGPARVGLADDETGEYRESSEERMNRYAKTIHDNLYIGS